MQKTVYGMRIRYWISEVCSSDLRLLPTSSIVMMSTVVVVVATHNLSLGVLAGVLLSGIFFAAKVQRMFEVRRDVSPDGMRATYFVTGQIFFASVDRFTRSFQVDEAAPNILKIGRAHV